MQVQLNQLSTNRYTLTCACTCCSFHKKFRMSSDLFIYQILGLCIYKRTKRHISSHLLSINLSSVTCYMRHTFSRTVRGFFLDVCLLPWGWITESVHPVLSVHWREKMWPDAVSWFPTRLSGEMQLCQALAAWICLVKCSAGCCHAEQKHTTGVVQLNKK